MLLTLSPMAEHMNESLCSLRFASKVNSTVSVKSIGDEDEHCLTFLYSSLGVLIRSLVLENGYHYHYSIIRLIACTITRLLSYECLLACFG